MGAYWAARSRTQRRTSIPSASPTRLNPAITGLKKNIITDISTAIATPLVICSIASMEYPSRSAIVVVSMA